MSPSREFSGWLSAGSITGSAALAAVYTVAGIAGLQFAFFHSAVTTVWPPSGIALAALLLFGKRLAPGVAIGAFIVNFWHSGSLVGALGVGLGNTLAALAGAWALTRLFRFDAGMARMRDIVALLLVGAAASPAVAATLGPLLLLAGGVLHPAEFAGVWFYWWLGDSLGVMLFTPLILAWYRRPSGWMPRDWQAVGLAIAQAATAFLIFHGITAEALGTQRSTYALLPCAIWLAIAYALRYTTASNALLFFIAIGETAAGLGPFAAGDPASSILPLHLFLAVATFTTLLVAGVNAERIAALALARENAERFRQLAGLTADWYWEQDESLRFTSVGESRHLASEDVALLIGRTCWEVPYSGVSPEQKLALDRLVAEHKPFRDFVMTRSRANGEPWIVSTSGYPILDDKGQFKGYRGIGRDVTRLKLAENSLRKSELRYRSLAALSAEWYWEQDSELRFVQLGDDQDRPGVVRDYVGKRRWDLPYNVATPEEWARHKADLDAHRPFRDFVFTRVDDEGCVRDYVSVSGHPVFDEAGKFSGYRGIGCLVTTRIAIEKALRASEERFRGLTQLSSDWYWEQDAELRFTFVSSAIDTLSGVDPNQRLGKRRWEIPALRFDPAALEEHKKLLAERKPFRDFRYTREFPDKGVRHISVAGTPLFDTSGNFTGYRGIGSDVTAEVVAGQRMARLRDFYAALSKVNDAIIHASDEQRLFDEVCNIAVTHGHVIFARICLINPQTGMLDNVAIAGNHQGYADRAPISIDPDRPEGQGPTAVALRTNQPDVCNDIETDSRNVFWRSTMMATGVRSYVVFPLNRGGQVAGSLHIYAAGRNWFDDDLVALITELAENISFTLDNFAREDARRNAEMALRASEQRFRDVAEAAGEFVWENDLEGRFSYVSPRVVEYTGYTAEELIGRTAVEFMPPGEGERIRLWLADNTQPDRSFRGMEHKFISKSGDILWMQVSAVSIWDQNRKPAGQRGTTRDVSEAKRSAERISYLATRDPLTELPNRLLFNDRLEQGIINARRNGEKLAVLFIDLDRFKNINDSLGHHIGDLLLKEVSSLMGSCIRRGDTLSRLGGDEFVVTLDGLNHAEDAANVARKIVGSLSRPIAVADHMLNTTCSVGISIFPIDADNGLELMKNADTAMYHAKEHGRNNFQFFSPEMNTRAVERHQLETEMRRALEGNQFVLHYQPQADIATGRLVGMEALIRWQHPERGLVPPASFIPVAEESGLIELIGRWALKTACEQNRKWQAEGLPPLKVAVNISARQFTDPRGFALEVTRLLDAIGLDPRYLELEMTESLLLKNVDENVAVLRRLGQLGTRLAVDDFGTGYSSLAYLKQLPIDTLKIDRTFVRDIEVDSDDAAIIQAIIAMAHGLDLRVTAEGVETEGQLKALRGLGCDEYQGYLLAKPLPAAEFRTTFLTDPPKSARSRQRRA